MTLCVGLVEDGRCIIGADSYLLDSDELGWLTSEPKCWAQGGLLWTDAGSSGPAQTIRASFTVPPDPPPQGTLIGDVQMWVYRQLIPALRELLPDLAQEEDAEHDFMLGISGHLCNISASDWSASWTVGPMAIGNPRAAAAARGSLHATGQEWASGLLGMDAEARISLALDAGALVSPYVAGPWSFVRE